MAAELNPKSTFCEHLEIDSKAEHCQMSMTK